MTDDDYDALSQKQLASIKRDMRISLEDAAVRATYKVMAELETEQNQGEEHMTHELIAKLTEMLEAQTKLTETAVDMLKPAIDAAYQKGYADAMGWKTQNHLEHLPPQENT